MTPEQLARQAIDRQLDQCGWIVQDHQAMNISEGPGVAVREFPLKSGHADYLLYADGRVVGVIEAKPEGHTLTGVETQSAKYQGRWRAFGCEELLKRDKVNLDIFWLKDESLEESDDLPDPDVLAQEIVDDLQTALEQFQAISEKLKA